MPLPLKLDLDLYLAIPRSSLSKIVFLLRESSLRHRSDMLRSRERIQLATDPEDKLSLLK